MYEEQNQSSMYMVSCKTVYVAESAIQPCKCILTETHYTLQ